MSQAEQEYKKAVDRFIKRNPQSHQIYEQACKSTPGGNTRTVLYYHPFPLCIEKGAGSVITDVDGHDYVDLLGEYTAGLYGHSDTNIDRAILDAIARGIGYGSQNKDEVKLAHLIQQRFPSMELLRFTNSGTEANLMALAIAKAYTGKKKIMVFNGAYHGGLLSWKNGKDSPMNAPHDFLIARYNDVTSVQDLLSVPGNGDDLAAIVVEPMIGSGGCIPGHESFLQALRGLAKKHKALLIYDEVMTSRLRGGRGLQSMFSEQDRPDLTTLGKYIGGGMSFGAFGGRHDIMIKFDPRQPDHIAHAGTFNNNVLSMAAGIAGLTQSFTPEKHDALVRSANELQRDLREISKGTIIEWTGIDSIQAIHFTSTPWHKITCPEDVADADASLSGLFHLWLLEHGYHIGRRGFMALSFALTEQQYEGFKIAVRNFIQQYHSLIVQRNHKL